MNMNGKRYVFFSKSCACMAVAMCTLSMLTGCNKAPYELAPVVGKVTIDGQPLADGQVMFAPRAKGGDGKAGKPAMGNIKPDGTFTLSTYAQGDGAVVGEHIATIYGPEEQSALPPGVPKFSKLTLPGRSFNVSEEGRNEIEIALAADDFKQKKFRGIQSKR